MPKAGKKIQKKLNMFTVYLQMYSRMFNLYENVEFKYHRRLKHTIVSEEKLNDKKQHELEPK